MQILEARSQLFIIKKELRHVSFVAYITQGKAAVTKSSQSLWLDISLVIKEVVEKT